MNIRSFIALPIPHESVTLLQTRLRSFKSTFPDHLIRWLPDANIHLTIKFLGDLPFEVIQSISRELSDLANGTTPFEIQLSHIGVFPNYRKPQIIWVGSDKPATLFTFQNVIESIAEKHGIRRETRPFSPHFTIGRISRNITGYDLPLITSEVTSYIFGDAIKFQANYIAVMKSVLKPDGAEYSPMFIQKFSK